MDLENNEAESFLTRFRQLRPEATTFVIAVRDPNKNVQVDAAIVYAVLNKPLEIDTLAEVVRECAIVPSRGSASLRTRGERGARSVRRRLHADELIRAD